MKLFLLSISFFVCVVFVAIQSSLHAQAPCDNSDNLTVLDDFKWNNSTFNGNDIFWDVVVIDLDDNEATNDGWVAVGESFTSPTAKRQGLIVYFKEDEVTGDLDVEWAFTYEANPGTGSNQNDILYGVAQASDHNIIVCGTTRSTEYGGLLNKNAWFLKVDIDNGQELANEEFGGSGDDEAFDIVEDLNGDYVIAGGTGDTKDGDLSTCPGGAINAAGEYWVFAIDPTNMDEIEWQRKFHGDSDCSTGSWNDYARQIVVDHEGYYAVAGYCLNCEANCVEMQSMIVKFSLSGVQWKKDHGDESSYNKDQGSHFAMETQEGSNYRYVTTGVHHPNMCFSSSSHNVYVTKVNPTNGNHITTWSPGCHLDQGKTYGGDKPDEGYSAVEDCDGNYLIAGGTKSKNSFDVDCNNGEAGTYDGWLLSLSTSGTILWKESLGSTGDDQFYSIKKNGHDASYTVVGEFSVNNEGLNGYIAIIELNDCPVRMANDLSAIPKALQVFPNPTDGWFDLSLTFPLVLTQIINVKIVDCFGKAAYQTQIAVDEKLSQRINVQSFSAGIYLVTVESASEIYQSKLIIQ
ncbi:MAG: T9SS type A sorting domain-containing protein [Chitinophagales bacterium]|nr:T9SS type A sorting domain-containing protein [Chitinophagales bacterium]